MAVYRRSARPRFTLLLLVLSATTLVTLDVRGTGGGTLEGLRSRARDGFSPIQSTGSAIVAPVGDVLDGVFRHRHLVGENARLRQELADARSAQVAAVGAQRENADLKAILNLEFVPGLPSVAARVVAGPESNFQLSVVINRGSASGVSKGMPVVSGTGLVGRIEAVSRNQSTVLLITDPSFAVGIRLASSGAVAVASGQGASKPLSVGLVGPDTAVAPGDAVVTSGLQQSPYPAGIPVGTVRSAATSPGALRKVVQLDPVVDVGRLAFLKVLLARAR